MKKFFKFFALFVTIVPTTLAATSVVACFGQKRDKSTPKKFIYDEDQPLSIWWRSDLGYFLNWSDNDKNIATVVEKENYKIIQKIDDYLEKIGKQKRSTVSRASFTKYSFTYTKFEVQHLESGLVDTYTIDNIIEINLH